MNIRLHLIICGVFIALIGSAQSSQLPGAGYPQEQHKSVEEIKIFPNPATDFFQINNSSIVKKVVLYNIVGKEVKTFIHYNNAQHEISDLKAGMYFIKMFDEKNRVVRSLKLNKSFDGA